MKLYLLLVACVCGLLVASQAKVVLKQDICSDPPDFQFRVDQLCDVSGITQGPGGCIALPLLLALGVQTQPPTCRSNASSLAGISAPPHIDHDGVVLPQDLPDARSELTGYLPQELNPAAYLTAEGGTYFWYYRNLMSLFNWAPCALPGSGSDIKFPVPKGWDVAGIFDLPSDPSLPFGVLLKPDPSYSHMRRDSCRKWYEKAAVDLKASLAEAVNTPGDGYYHGKNPRHDDYDSHYHHLHDGGDDGWHHHHYGWDHHRYDEHYSCGRDEADGTSPHLVLLLRGSWTLTDWGLDLTYNQTSDANYGPGMFSVGFYTAAEGLWQGGLGAALEREIARGCRSITITGHSLGGTVAKLLAVRIEALLSSEATRGAKAAPVTVVTFGSPAVGDEDWVDHYNTKINARSIAFAGDAVPQLPCVPQTAGCPAPVDTTQAEFWYYNRTGGNIIVPGASMPFNTLQPGAWSSLENTSLQQLCTPELRFSAYVATHLCSYLCMSSPYVEVRNNLCWLDPAQDTPVDASLCSW